jgi:hypothetical protein
MKIYCFVLGLVVILNGGIMPEVHSTDSIKISEISLKEIANQKPLLKKEEKNIEEEKRIKTKKSLFMGRLPIWLNFTLGVLKIGAILPFGIFIGIKVKDCEDLEDQLSIAFCMGVGGLLLQSGVKDFLQSYYRKKKQNNISLSRK